jgi:ribonuclease HII
MPTLDMERAAGGRVAGIDEAGRGPLAGPVVAAAVVLPDDAPAALLDLLDDSKKLTEAQRLTAYAALRLAGVEIGIGAASVAEIARLNILHAAMLAMHRAVSRLQAPPDLALVDGNYPPKLGCKVQCVVGGDAACLSIAAASIVAKVVRDRAMHRLAVRWPGYGWESNAGYATEAHRSALGRLGPTWHHRAGFGTVAQLQLELEATATLSPAVTIAQRRVSISTEQRRVSISAEQERVSVTTTRGRVSGPAALGSVTIPVTRKRTRI